ncbi:ISL3 family transposase, partial [Streptomyces zhihengii]
MPTERLRSTLSDIGLALAGRAGARMSRVLGVGVSRSMVLRLVDVLPEPDLSVPRVAGVDEYATRKGRHYGTVLVDVETRRPVDLLADREASSLAACGLGPCPSQASGRRHGSGASLMAVKCGCRKARVRAGRSCCG